MNVALYITSSLLVFWLSYNILTFLASSANLILSFKKSLRMASVIFGLIAMELGGSMMLGSCQEGYSSGIYGILYVVGISIGFILLGLGIAQKMKAMNVENTLDLFEIKYRSPLIRASASLLSTLTIWGLLLGQLVAAKSLFSTLNIGNETVGILFCLYIIIYALVGGLSYTNMVYSGQMIYTIILFGVVFLYCMIKEPPSYAAHIVHIIPTSPETTITFSTIFASVVMPALYYLTDQEYARPLFTLNSRKATALCAVAASIFMILFSLVPIYFGIHAKAIGIPVPDDTSPLIAVLKVMTNETVVILAVIGMIAALVSMIDYYLWSVGASITHELTLAYKPLQSCTWLSKAMILLAGLSAVITMYSTTSTALQILLYSYELYDSCLIIPLLMSYFQSDLKKGAAIGAIFFGLISFVVCQCVELPIPGQAVSLGLSLIGYYVGSFGEQTVKRWAFLKRSKTCSV